MVRRILVYANCQGLVVAKALLRHRDLRHAEVRTFENYKDDPAALRVASGCDLVLAQLVHGESYRKRFAALLAALPDGAQVIRFPAMHASHLWPQYFQDYSVKPEPGFKHGRFPWGNRLLLKLFREGLPRNQIIDTYLSTDLAMKYDLKGLFRLALGSIRQLEAQCEVKISDVYENSIFERQTFFSPYHAANFIVNAISNRIFGFLGLPVLQPDELPQGDLLRDAELPVHWSVAEYFGLKFISADTVYLSRSGTNVNARQFCAEYVDWLQQREAVNAPAAHGEDGARIQAR